MSAPSEVGGRRRGGRGRGRGSESSSSSSSESSESDATTSESSKSSAVSDSDSDSSARAGSDDDDDDEDASSSSSSSSSETEVSASESARGGSEDDGEADARAGGGRERGFVGRVVGALTPANWGFRLRASPEGGTRVRDGTTRSMSGDSGSESATSGSGSGRSGASEREGSRDGDASEDDDDEDEENERERRRRRRRGDAATTSKSKRSKSRWEREERPTEPTPWIHRDAPYGGPFRENIKAFLNRYAECDGRYTEVGIMGYTVTLSKGEKYETKLRIYEEAVAESERAHCDCCRCIGWVHQPVNKKQYHFIVHTDFKARNKPELAGKRICQLCCCAVSASEKKCSVCDEVDRECSILDHQTHLLHGMIHANGFGHLKRINGREAGSMALSGTQLMGLWETICGQLRAREVSVEDVSQKYGVELRLLNPVSRGATWYGTYGYVFGKGSFGNTLMTHKRATELLRKFPLRHLRSDFTHVKDLPDKENQRTGVDIVQLLDKYTRIFDNEDVSMSTLGELVSNVMALQRDIRLAVKEGRRAPERLALHGVAAVLAGAKVVDKKGEYKRNITDSPKLAKRPPRNGEPLAKKARTNMDLPRSDRARALRPREDDAPTTTAVRGKDQSTKAYLPSTPIVRWGARGQDVRAVSKSRWSEARLNIAANACVLALRDDPSEWMSRQEVRTRAREKGIGDTGLLDHILKIIGDRRVVFPNGENGLISRRQNKSQMEFSLKMDGKRKRVEDDDDDETPVLIKAEPELETKPSVTYTNVPSMKLTNARAAQTIDELTAAEVDADLITLYHDVLENYKPARLQQQAGQRVTVKGGPLVDAARTLLDTKQFVKIYTHLDDLLDSTPANKLAKPAANAQKAIRIIVTAVMDTRNQGPALSGLGVNSVKARQRVGTVTRPPPEIVFLPSEPTLGDLKRNASKAFRDLYVVLSDFKVTRVKGYEGVSDKTRLGWRKMQGASVEVHGEGADLESEYRYQGGFEQWTVECVCGTRDDDGERMIACDRCGIWMHTRCVGIKDSAKAPSSWTCPNCSPASAKQLEPAPKRRPPPRER